MPIRFEAYRFTERKTPLSAETFNGILRDLDLRIASLEDLKVSWESISGELEREGLRRLHETLVPIYQSMTEEQAAAVALRAELAALLAQEREDYADRMADLLAQAQDMLASIPLAGHQANMQAWAAFK